MKNINVLVPKLRPIAMEYLRDGIKISDNIYNYDGKVLLIAQGTTITSELLQKLRRFNCGNRNLSVSEKTYVELIEYDFSSVNLSSQEIAKRKVGYTDIKEKTESFLQNITESSRVSMQTTECISSEISNKLRLLDPSVIFQCINAPNPVDEYLRHHSVNVGFINGMMGKWLGLKNADIDLLVLAGLVHDIGKTKIPLEILNAPRRLTISEFEIMKTHPIYSYELLIGDPNFPPKVYLAARQHHEKLNGKGYPDGIDINEITLFARVTAVADIYDAMVSKRVYKKANNPFKIISLLSNKQFSELDINLVQLFTEKMPAELIGKPVLLSDGSIAKIKYIVHDDLEYPFVDIDGQTIKTTPKLYCANLVLDA